jgi:hypothetical protein
MALTEPLATQDDPAVSELSRPTTAIKTSIVEQLSGHATTEFDNFIKATVATGDDCQYESEDGQTLLAFLPRVIPQDRKMLVDAGGEDPADDTDILAPLDFIINHQPVMPDHPPIIALETMLASTSADLDESMESKLRADQLRATQLMSQCQKACAMCVTEMVSMRSTLASGMLPTTFMIQWTNANSSLKKVMEVADCMAKAPTTISPIPHQYLGFTEALHRGIRTSPATQLMSSGHSTSTSGAIPTP